MRRLCQFGFALVVLINSAVTPIRADAPPEPPKTFDLTAIDTYIDGQVRAKGYIGLSLAVLRDGKLVFAKGYGRRSMELALAVETDTPFAIGSITKQFVCACVLLLADEGKLSASDPVAKYYPELTRAQDITLHDLMSHLSGYPDYYPLDFVDRRMMKPTDADVIIREYAGGKLDFEPGSRWSYSNTGFTILGRVVEKVSGKSLAAFLEQRIFKPLHMDHSFLTPKSETPGLARGYTAFALGLPEPAPVEQLGWLDAAGGIYASASDLAKWDLALLSGKVLKPQSYQLMTTSRRLKNGKSANYGCGLSIVQREGETILQHGGAVSGFLASNAMIPRTQSAVILLANSEDVSPSPLHSTVLGLLLKDQAAKEGPSIPKVNGPPAKDAALAFFHDMQSGAIDRSKLGEEFSYFLNEERVKAAAARYKPLGEPEKVEVAGTSERGGMEVASIRMAFKNAKLTGLLYRSPDGKIQQLLLHKE
jgi:CubicO group peptidase (beta-lactamase class C family)